MSEHTPGPWRYDPETGYIWGRSVGGCGMREDDHLIADVRGWGHLQYLPDGRDIQDANGYLLTAAPKLLAALKEVLAAERATATPPKTAMQAEANLDRIRAAVAQAEAAIAKATGDEQ